MKNLIANIEAALSRSVCGGWDRGFLESLLEQIDKGRTLSLKQKQTLGKVLARNDKAAQEIHESWATTYQNEYKPQAVVLAKYHLRQPCLLYTSPSPRDLSTSRMPSSA